MSTERKSEEQEFDLREFINVIIKRKVIILTVFFVSVVTTVSIVLFIPKEYSSTSIIQIGNLDGLVLTKEVAKTFILIQKNLIGVINDLNLKIDQESLRKRISVVDLSGTDCLLINVNFINPKTAKKINEMLPVYLFLYGHNIYQKKLVILNEQLSELEQEIQSLEIDVKATQNLLMDLRKSTDDFNKTETILKTVLLKNSLPSNEISLAALKSQRNNLKMTIAMSSDFCFIDNPIESKKSISRGTINRIFVSVVFGLIIGSFLAFFIEFLEKSKVDS